MYKNSHKSGGRRTLVFPASILSSFVHWSPLWTSSPWQPTTPT